MEGRREGLVRGRRTQAFLIKGLEWGQERGGGGIPRVDEGQGQEWGQLGLGEAGGVR